MSFYLVSLTSPFYFTWKCFSPDTLCTVANVKFCLNRIKTIYSIFSKMILKLKYTQCTAHDVLWIDSPHHALPLQALKQIRSQLALPCPTARREKRSRRSARAESVWCAGKTSPRACWISYPQPYRLPPALPRNCVSREAYTFWALRGPSKRLVCRLTVANEVFFVRLRLRLRLVVRLCLHLVDRPDDANR